MALSAQTRWVVITAVSTMTVMASLVGLIVTYQVLSWIVPDLVGGIAANPARWALWVALALLPLEFALVAWMVLRADGGQYLPVGERTAEPRAPQAPRLVLRIRGFALTAAVTTVAALFVFGYVGGFPLDGRTTLLVVITVFACYLPPQVPPLIHWAVRRLRHRRQASVAHRSGKFDAFAEFDRQLEHLLQCGYPRLADLTPSEFTRHVEPLKGWLRDLEFDPNQSREIGRIPFVIVIRQALVPADQTIRLVQRRGKAGTSIFTADAIRRLVTIPTVVVPAGWAYLIFDIDTGRDLREVAPDEALKRIEADHRSPLTVEEGIAVITHDPKAFDAGWYSLPGTRRSERMVTALWVDKGRPTLGPWQGNEPNRWLGSASCRERRGSIAHGDSVQQGE